jgi:cell division protein FtsI (penicillin-binding protein 3)
VLATLGFGYGLSVTTLQLAQAYAVFANGGYWIPAKFQLAADSFAKKQVISAETSQQVLNMLEAVVEDNGTGRKAQVVGYRVAGKTGTSRIAGKNGYDKNRHIASFVGIAPVSAPKLVIAVVVREPRKISYYGGRVAGPLFSQVMGESLRILGISPDKTLS